MQSSSTWERVEDADVKSVSDDSALEVPAEIAIISVPPSLAR